MIIINNYKISNSMKCKTLLSKRFLFQIINDLMYILFVQIYKNVKIFYIFILKMLGNKIKVIKIINI